ncbi:hypothetical protein PG5_50610 [Pseudomonas sp. G5(2012)]|nr:hypothetical protein PG5_50610 [Pseudomonas sp. G5(2012)]
MLRLKELRYGAQLEEGKNILQGCGLFMAGANQNVSSVPGFEDNTIVETCAHA